VLLIVWNKTAIVFMCVESPVGLILKSGDKTMRAFIYDLQISLLCIAYFSFE